MKKLTKALAAVLLAAIVLSCFAVFSAFAEDAAVEDAAATSERVVIWNMDDYDSLTLNHANEKGNSGDSLTKITDEKGTYWHWTHDVDGTDNTYWEISFDTASSNYDRAAVIADILNTKQIEVDNGDGTTTTKLTYATKEDGSYDVEYEKNTDYVVVDFDISTDSTFISDMFFNMRNYGNAGQAVRDTTTFPTFNMNRPGTDELWVRYDKDKTSTQQNPFDAGRKWTNVTIIYDYSAEFDHASVEAGTAPERKAYVYIDGYYLYTMNLGQDSNVYTPSIPHTSSLDYAHQLGYWRVSSGNDGTNVAGSTTNFANFTVSKFPVGYDGQMTDDNVLGNASVNIGSISDLAYCLQDAPEEPDGYTRLPIAKINYYDETLEDELVYDEDDISGDVTDGDVVTLYRTLVSDFIVVRTKGDGSAVTFQDKNGAKVGEENCLVSAPNVVPVDPSVDWVVLVNGEAKTTGTASDIYIDGVDLDGNGEIGTTYAKSAGYYSPTKNEDPDGNADTTYSNAVYEKYASVIDPLHAALRSNSGTRVVMIFNDMTTYGPGPKYTNETCSSKATATIESGGSVTFDLNDNHLTVDTGSPNFHYMTSNAGGDITVKNGEFTFKGVAGNFAMIGNAAANADQTLLFDKVILNYVSGTMLDHRGGKNLFLNSVITTYTYISTTKSGCSNFATCIVDGCEVESTGNSAILFGGNVTGRYGSARLSYLIKGTTFTRSATMATGSSTYTKDSLFELCPCMNTKKHTCAACLSNDNRVYIGIVGSSFGEGFRHMIYQRSETIASILDQEDFKFNCDIVIHDSDVGGTSVVYSALTNGTKYPYTLNYDVAVSGDTKFGFVALNSTALALDEANSRFPTFSTSFADGVLLTAKAVEGIRAEDEGDVTVTYDTTLSEIVNTSLGGDTYDYIVTSSYDTYYYELGEQTDEEVAAQSFLWNVPTDGETIDEVNPSKAYTLPEDTALYQYSWAQNGKVFNSALGKNPDFKFTAKSNLTLCDYIYFNLYINKTQYDAAIALGAAVDGVTIDGSTPTTTVDGTVYYVVRAKDIKISDAGKAVMTVTLSFKGEYDDTYESTKEFSILSYAENMLKKEGESDESKALIKALLNYIASACIIVDDENGADAANTILTKYDAEYAAAAVPDDDNNAFGGLEGVSIALVYGDTLQLGVKATAGNIVTITYTPLGATESVSVSKLASRSGVVYFSMKAYDYASTVNIAVKEADGSNYQAADFNVQGYYNALSNANANGQYTQALEMVKAIYNYALAAKTYKESANG